ncbi:uncharacterized protein J3R85_004943 [Psidium guajava]|nr:uncharacterized protein J3R85_004943 [Psidium guajava]
MSCLIPLDIFYGQMHKFLPVGYRFRPTDDELVDHYLRGQIFGYNADTCIIPVIRDLYKIDPWDLPPRFRACSIVRSKEAEWWFLTRLSVKTQSRRKFDRQTQSGHWKTTGQEKEIKAKGTDKLIGTMKNLVFTENEGSSGKKETVWVMHEYRLNGCDPGTNTLDQQNLVLCHLVNRRDAFIDGSISAETGSMSPFSRLGDDKARNDVPEVSTNMPCGVLQVQRLNGQNVMEAVMDPCAEALRPPVNPNLPSNPHLVDMGAPSNIDITNDNQSDLLKYLVDMIDEDGPIDGRSLDAIIPPSSGTESDTDNGQGWWSPVNRPIEQGEHVDRLRQTTVRPPGSMPREEVRFHAQDNSNFPRIFMIQPVGYEPEINCLTFDPVPTRASRDRDRVQLRNKPSGKPASKGKVTPSKEPALPHHKPVLKWVKAEAEPAQLSCASARNPVPTRASRDRDRIQLQNKPSGKLASKGKVPPSKEPALHHHKPVLKWVKTEAEPAQLSCASAVSPPIPVFPRKKRFPPANHRVEFPPVAEFTDRHGKYCHTAKVPNPTGVVEAGRTKKISSAEAVLNWQTENALARNKILESIDSKISKCQTRLDHVEQKKCQTRLDHVEQKVDKTPGTMQEFTFSLEKLLTDIYYAQLHSCASPEEYNLHGVFVFNQGSHLERKTLYWQQREGEKDKSC